MKKAKNDVIKENDVNPEKAKKTKDPKVAAEYNAKVGFRSSIVVLVSVCLGFIRYEWSMYSIIDLVLIGLLILCIYKKDKNACIGMLIYYISCVIVTIANYSGLVGIIGIIIIVGLIQGILGCKYLEDHNLVKTKKRVRVLSIVLIVISSLTLAINVLGIVLLQLLGQ